MSIVVAYNALDIDAAPDEKDVLVQVAAIVDSLSRTNARVESLACDLNLEKVGKQLKEIGPELVFNLVETLSGSGRMVHFFPGLLDTMALPYTGSSAEALFLTSNKILAKAKLRAAGLPTPSWMWCRTGRLHCSETMTDAAADNGQWIVKSVWEHASVGIDEASILEWPGAEPMYDLLQERTPRLGGAGFAEAFVEGREFNLSVLDGPRGPKVLPAAEINFSDFEAGKCRIVDYRAKWDPASFEYHHTPRCFKFSETEKPLLDRLSELALACWQCFELRGYARIDFRVDHSGQPWILEVNANPCLSPDAGFAAAVEQAGLTYEAAIENIVAAARPIKA